MAQKKKLTAVVVLIGVSSFTPRQRDACDAGDWRRRPTAKQGMVLEISAFFRRCTKGQPDRLLAGKVLVTKSCWLAVHSFSSWKTMTEFLKTINFHAVNSQMSVTHSSCRLQVHLLSQTLTWCFTKFLTWQSQRDSHSCLSIFSSRSPLSPLTTSHPDSWLDLSSG